MSQVQATEPAGEQKLDRVEQVLYRMIGHADTFRGFLADIASISPLEMAQKPELMRIAAQGLSNVPRKLDTEIEDLTTIVEHIGRIRKIATERGYADVLELLNQELPYDRHY